MFASFLAVFVFDIFARLEETKLFQFNSIHKFLDNSSYSEDDFFTR